MRICRDYLRFGLAMTLLIVVLNSVAAAWLARRYKKAIFGFEPEQMGRLYAELDCTLRTVREGSSPSTSKGASPP